VLISRYAKVLLQTPGTGSIVLCLAGLSLGAVVIARWGQSGPAAPAIHGQTPVRSASPSHAPSGSLAMVVVGPQQSSGKIASSKRSQPHLQRVVFREPIASDLLGVLSDYAGKPTKEALQVAKVRDAMTTLVPYAPFHFGLDRPLPSIIETVLLRSSVPIGIRDGRYMMLTTDTGSGPARGFFWIDLQQGIAVGGIFFHPNNGEPTPTLTLFSKQVKQDSLKMSQLPVAFAQDLSAWIAMAGIPPVTTRYFINGSGEKLVLTHDEDYCKQSPRTHDASPDECRQMKAEAADMDLRAASFLGQTHYASNATMRMTAVRSPDGLLIR
jgi:hypothetical protein